MAGLRTVARWLVLAAAVPRPAQATEGAAPGDSQLELHSFYKSTWSAVRFPTALVEPLPRVGALATHSARLWGRAGLGPRLDLAVGYQLDARVATAPALVGAGTLGASAGSRVRAERRLLDLEPELAAADGTLLEQNLDLLAVTVRAEVVDLTVGRQVLSWGSGRLWNPTDLLSPFAPTDLDREVRRGVDAVRASVPLADTAELELLYLPQRDGADQGAVLRTQANLAGFDLAPSVAKYVRDVVFGFDAAGDLGAAGVHAEIAALVAADGAPAGEPERFVRAVTGVDLLPGERVAVTAEYYFNGFGARSADGYFARLRSERVARGEVFGAGQHYLGLVTAWQGTDLVTLQAIVIVNLLDPSALVVPSLEWWAAQDLLVRVGGTVPLGRRPEPRPLELRSEYGAAASGLFASVAVYPF